MGKRMSKLDFNFQDGDPDAQRARIGRISRDDGLAGEAEVECLSGETELRLVDSATPIPLRFIESNGRSSFNRSWADVRSSKMHYVMLWVVSRGELRVHQSGTTLVVRAGQLGLVDSSRPARIQHQSDRQGRLLSLYAGIPAHLFREGLGNREIALEGPVSCRAGNGYLVGQLLGLLHEQGDTIDCDVAVRLVDTIVTLLTRLIRDQPLSRPAKCSISERRIKEIMTQLDLRLCNASLSASEVARACGISTRYLHDLLRSAGQSFAEERAVRRHDRVCRWLRSDAMAHVSLAEIAAMAGYRSPAELSRSFRARSGTTPTTYRRAQQSIRTSKGDGS